jgi:hypothetical protein
MQSTCPHCKSTFAARVGAKPQRYCSASCRRAVQNARAAEQRTQALGSHRNALQASKVTKVAATPSKPASNVLGRDSSRLATLLDAAHSRRGLNAWEIAELARLRGIDPAAPLNQIFGRPSAASASGPHASQAAGSRIARRFQPSDLHDAA